MKKIIFIVFFLLVVKSGAFAQFRLGPVVGVSVSNFVYEDKEYKALSSNRFSPGYQLGVVLNYRVTKVYSLQTELSFLRKGIDVRYKGEFGDVLNKASFSYLSAPALLRISSHKFIGGQHLEFYVNIGPEVNYWLGGRGVLETTEPAPFVKEGKLPYTVLFKGDDGFGKYMVVEEPSRIQMAVAAGGGLIFDIGKDQHCAIDVRGTFGLGKSFHGQLEGGDYGLNLYAENLEAVHHTLAVSVSYILKFDLNTYLRKGRVASAYGR